MDLKKAAFIEAWGQTFGNITQTCKAVDITRQTYYNWMESDPEFKAEIQSVNPEEILLDFVEKNLVKKIREGDTACLIFMAKTKGKKRGYVERAELSGPNGGAIPVETKNVVEFHDYTGNNRSTAEV